MTSSNCFSAVYAYSTFLIIFSIIARFSASSRVRSFAQLSTKLVCYSIINNLQLFSHDIWSASNWDKLIVPIQLAILLSPLFDRLWNVILHLNGKYSVWTVKSMLRYSSAIICDQTLRLFTRRFTLQIEIRVHKSVHWNIFQFEITLISFVWLNFTLEIVFSSANTFFAQAKSAEIRFEDVK